MMLQRLNLGLKFSLLLVLIFIVGSALGGLVLSDVLLRRAEAHVTTEGIMLMESISAVRDYTNTQIRPLVEANLGEDEFEAVIVPAYSAHQVFQVLQDSDRLYSDVRYKEAVVNPTNPADQADDFEQSVIGQFLNNDRLAEISDFHTLSSGEKMFYSARPLTVGQQSCLRCHGVPEDAPQQMLDIYGDENGFGWTVGSVIGAQMVYVPAQQVFQSASQAFASVMGLYIAIFAIAIGVLNIVLKPTVLRPVQQLARISQKLSLGELETEERDRPGEMSVEVTRLEKVATRQDELGQLAQVFRTMVQEVIAREQRLRDQVKNLRIEIDQARREREVKELTDNDFFRDLQQKAKEHRRKSRRNDSES